MQRWGSLIAAAVVLSMGAIAQGYLFLPATSADAREHAQAWIKAHPDRAEGYFFLGAVEGSAWAKGTEGQSAQFDVASYGNANDPPRLVPWTSILFVRDAGRKITDRDVKYLEASIAAYQKAVALDPATPRYRLGLAWALEQAATARMKPLEDVKPLSAEERKAAEAAIGMLGDAAPETRDAGSRTLAGLMPRNAELLLALKSEDPEVMARVDRVLQGYWQSLAVEQYRAAYRATVDADSKAKEFDGEGDGMISAKAGERLLRLLPAQDGTGKETAAIQAAIAAMKEKPMRAVFY